MAKKEIVEDQTSLRIAHLGMIQGVIARMASFSATAKNFAVTVGAAIVAIAFDKQTPSLIWAAGAAVSVFLLMDAYYHLLEVRYRDLYKTTADRPIEAGSNMLMEAPKATSANVRKVASSPTLLPFYVLLLFALAIALIVACDVQQTQPPSTRDPTGSSEPTQHRVERARQLESPTAPSQRRTGRLPEPAADAKDKRPGDAG